MLVQHLNVKSTLSKKGFTLAELLVALAILGVIASFTIPKILHSADNDRKKAVLRETIGAMENLIFTGFNDGSIANSPDTLQFFTTKLNISKICPSNGQTEGCYNATASFICDREKPEGAFIMPSGVTVFGLRPGFKDDDFCIDWNGEGGPNIEGDDMLLYHINFNLTNVRSIMYYDNGSNTTNLYQSVFSN